MTERDPVERAAAIDTFVQLLVTLRAEAGNPSFRSMAKRSGAISHATMHDAVQGVRLPSWETTVEFAKACSADPAQLREAWQQADAIVHPPESALVAVPPAVDDVGPDDPEPASNVAPVQHDHAIVPDRRPRLLLIGGLVAGAALALGAVTTYQAMSDEGTRMTTNSRGDASTTASTPSAAAAFGANPSGTPAVCPSNTATHSSQPPRTAGDGARLIADVTLPDCSTQPRNGTLVKTWRIKNTGSVEWTGRTMRRIDPLQGDAGCHTPEDTPIPAAKPGATVEVSVSVRTPSKPATCFVRWKIGR